MLFYLSQNRKQIKYFFFNRCIISFFHHATLHLLLRLHTDRAARIFIHFNSEYIHTDTISFFHDMTQLAMAALLSK